MNYFLLQDRNHNSNVYFTGYKAIDETQSDKIWRFNRKACGNVRSHQGDYLLKIVSNTGECMDAFFITEEHYQSIASGKFLKGCRELSGFEYLQIVTANTAFDKCQQAKFELSYFEKHKPINELTDAYYYDN